MARESKFIGENKMQESHRKSFVGYCDKCGKSVPEKNSALRVQEEATQRFAGFVKDRHLFPSMKCEGSPSRVNLVQTDTARNSAYEALQNGEGN